MKLHDASVGVILLGVMSLVKYEKADLTHGNETIVEAIQQNLGSADNDTMSVKLIIPKCFILHMRLHISEILCNWPLQVASYHVVLLQT
jgi:hypothetical protein